MVTNLKLYELADLAAEIEATKSNPQYSALLAYFDSSSGVIPIVNKLPFGIQEKWTSFASSYKRTHNVAFPPFSMFVDFLQDVSQTRNDPCFAYDYTSADVPRKQDKLLINKAYTNAKVGLTVASDVFLGYKEL